MTTNETETYKAISEHPCPSMLNINDGTRLDKPCGADTIPPTPGTDEEGYYCPRCGLVSE